MHPCQEARRKIILCVPHGVPSNQRFYPRDSLKAVLTRDRVAQVLDCSCQSCQQKRKRLKQLGSPSDFIDAIVDDRAPTISLFALLILINGPPLVVGFLTKQVSDNSLVTEPERYLHDIGETYWRPFHRKNREDSEALECEFQNYLFHFAVPTLTFRHHHIFHPQTILPFVEQRQLGRPSEDGNVVNEGAYGTVYKCKIWPAHNALPGSQGIEWFARKELDGPTRLSNTERENLQKVYELRDRHIVKIIKTYEFGGKYNIIFPCARTNLRNYLQEEKFRSPVIQVETDPLWQQVLGVSKALDHIINFDTSTISHNERRYRGFHFDLKPENILVENDDTLLISDFGQAIFKETGGSSGVRGHGGTEAYAPPEIERLNDRQTQKYDIWSLGCIFVEIVTVLVRGSGGLYEFDRLRQTSTSNETDDRFFEIDTTRTEYKVKGVILDWIEELPRLVESQRSREFLEKFVCLIKHMLKVDVRDRLLSSDVVRSLEEILQQYRENDNVPLFELPRPRDGEVTLGATELSKIKMWYKNDASPEWSTPSQIFAFLSDSRLRIVVIKNNMYFEKITPQKDLMLVPKYAFEVPDRAGEWLFFKTVASGNDMSFRGDKFSFSRPMGSRPPDAHIMQSVFTGQCVKVSCGVTKVEYELTPLRKIFDKVLHRPHKLPDDEKACVVQLWKETQYADSKQTGQVMYDSHGQRPPRDLPPSESVKRMAIFHYKRIVVVPLDVNWTVKKNREETDLRAVLEPTDAGKVPYFRAATLNSNSDEDSGDRCYPGIPLDTAILREQEENNEVKCSRIIVYFKELQGREGFEGKFKKMRSELKKQG